MMRPKAKYGKQVNKEIMASKSQGSWPEKKGERSSRPKLCVPMRRVEQFPRYNGTGAVSETVKL